MSDNRKNINGKLTGKKVGILAAAALTATMVGGNVQVVTQPVRAAQTQEESRSVLPDNITIDQPAELAEISLPASEYGTLEWADGSYVPTQRVQSCEVILTPGKGQDLSHVDGWDPEEGVVVGYINVIVNNIDNSSTDETDPEITEIPEETPDATEAPAEDDKNSKDEAVSKDENEDSKDVTDGDDTKDEKADDKNSDKGNMKADSKDKDADAGDKKSDTADTVGELEPTDDADQSTDTADDNNNTDNIFDNPVLPDQNDKRPTDADDSLTDDEKEERAEINHTCDGITVSGINLPWYVQFRVSSGDSYQFTNESDAMIFQSYEFELWDLQNNTEYEIPSGEYISVTVPVKAGYQYTIEHLLDNGATETIIPSVDNDVMVFSTHSFSPFGIAGSKQLVGPDGVDGSDDTDAVTPTPTVASTQGETSDSGNGNTVSVNDNSDNNSNGSSSSAQTDSSAENETAKNNSAVNTGDTTTILPFVVLVVAAAVIIGAVVFIKKKKK